MKRRLFAQVSFAAFALLGLSGAVSAEGFDGEMLLYQKSEPGIAPYPSRIIVTEEKMRLDDGVDGGDFALLDRKARIVYSVTHSDRTVLEVHHRPVDVESPLKLDLIETEIPAGKDVPRIGGRTPTHHRLHSGQKSCYDVVAVPGLLPQSVRAMGEFREIMAGEHAATLIYVPADQQEPCDLAMNIYRHGWVLEHGLPIQEWDGEGRGRVLMDFDEDYEADPALFELPEGYRHYRITPEQ